MKYIQNTWKRSIGFHAFCLLLAALMIYPVVWMLSGSLKTQAELFKSSLSLIPASWRWANFSEGWQGFGGNTFATFFKNSFMISILGTLGTVISSALVAYGFARVDFKGKKFFFGAMMATMMLPYQIIMVPQYLIFKQLHWVNTFLPLIVPQWLGGTPFFIFMVIQFIYGIPKELDEAAYIDGCNIYTIFWHVIAPLLKAPLVTVAIFQFYWRWEDFLQPLIYLSKPERYPVSVALSLFADPTAQTNWGALLAMGVASIVPVIIVFALLQRYIVEGISTTGLKG